MKKFLITTALVSSFLILCFGWLLAGGPNDAHTWDERSNGTIEDQLDKGAKPAAIVLVPLGQSYLLVWKEPTAPSKWQGSKLGGFNYLIIRGR